MGITGLLPFVKPASSERHLSTLRGQTAAIDSYCWLHKGAFGCAEKIAMGEATDMYVSYCMKYVDMLINFRIKPIMVFDGQHLPAKLLTEKKRRESRNQARKRASECLKLGKMEEARSNFKRCVDITPEMALNLIKECRRRNIDCIVAPYEADSQLAYLNQKNIADFIISEDSDLLTFGCKKVLFKLDLTGVGTLVEDDKLYLATKERPDEYSSDRFRLMCILSGCDYIESLPGIGLKKALKFLKQVSCTNIYDSITKLPSILNMKHLTITKEYREQLMIADATFRHQLVFDLNQLKLIPLIDPEKVGTKIEYCCNSGKMLDDETAFQLAIGNLNPFTLEKMDDWCPDTALKKYVSPCSSIWHKSFKTTKKVVIDKVKKISGSPVKLNGQNPSSNLGLSDEVYDEKTEEKLLMMYSIKEEEEPPAKRICIREEKETKTEEEKEIKTEEENVEESTSPILSKRRSFSNPFLKKTNKSNTIINERKVVVSKYFNSNSEVVKVEASSTIIEKTVENIVDNEESISTSENTSTSEIVSISEMVSTSEIVSTPENISTPENTPSLEDSQTDNKEISNSQGSNSSGDIENNTNALNVETVIKIKEIQPVRLSQATQITSCRRQGLSKKLKSVKPKNQPTLLSMFGFTKK